MPRKKEAVDYTDFKSLFKRYTAAVESNDVLRNSAILRQTLTDFGRMAEMNDNLWNVITEKGYYTTDDRGKITLNPAIGTYNKNVSTLLKSAQYLEEKTAAIALNDDHKSW